MLAIDKITKTYKKKYALKEISFQLENGVYGLIGENGAGKTTIMKILTGQTTFDTGRITYRGEAWSDDNRVRIGYLPQKFDFFDNLTVYEAMHYLTLIRGMAGSSEKEKHSHTHTASHKNESLLKWLDYLNLTEHTEKKIKNLSGGMKQRLGIAQAFMGDPEIILLDEPTSGLDPKERLSFRNMVNEVCEDKIILISTHILDDVESTCEKLIVIKKGEITYKGKIIDFKNHIGKDVYTTKILRKDLTRVGNEISIISVKREEEWLYVRYIENDMKSCRHPDIYQNKVKVDACLEDAYFYSTDLVLKGRR